MPNRLQLEGRDLEALLTQVRTEHGEQAKIVSADRVRRGGFAGFFARELFQIGVEVPAQNSGGRRNGTAGPAPEPSGKNRTGPDRGGRTSAGRTGAGPEHDADRGEWTGREPSRGRRASRWARGGSAAEPVPEPAGDDVTTLDELLDAMDRHEGATADQPPPGEPSELPRPLPPPDFGAALARARERLYPAAATAGQPTADGPGTRQRSGVDPAPAHDDPPPESPPRVRPARPARNGVVTPWEWPVVQRDQAQPAPPLPLPDASSLTTAAQLADLIAAVTTGAGSCGVDLFRPAPPGTGPGLFDPADYPATPPPAHARPGGDLLGAPLTPAARLPAPHPEPGHPEPGHPGPAHAAPDAAPTYADPLSPDQFSPDQFSPDAAYADATHADAAGPEPTYAEPLFAEPIYAEAIQAVPLDADPARGEPPAIEPRGAQPAPPPDAPPPTAPPPAAPPATGHPDATGSPADPYSAADLRLPPQERRRTARHARPVTGHADAETVRSGLRALGVPDGLLGAVTGGDLYADLVTALAGLPQAPPVSDAAGQVIGVTGLPPHTIEVAWRLARRLHLGNRQVIAAGPEPDAPVARRIAGLDDARRQAAALRAADSAHIVAVHAPLGSDGARWAGQVLAALGAGTVWAVVDATTKVADLRHQLADLGRVDALAVHATHSTADPASVLSLGIPVATVDGQPATPHVWAAVLAERLLPMLAAAAG